ncbi:hypothetical protein [Halomonas sp. 707B3]|uniref:hypothetical protein n=1 Tax=Halomonas sp. 707B3 TaxID=1681043 RepID=UPI0020A00E12|nr:hypothetical protein [Halomonas sp. 707B3]MCP1316849.1 hypothetical protein [Halomonas sp. 707B3]
MSREANKRLYMVGATPLDKNVEGVTHLARAVWYRGYKPSDDELKNLRVQLDDVGFRRVLCVLEMLSKFPVCKPETSSRLQSTAAAYLETLGMMGETRTPGRSSPSKRWGLPDDTVPVRQALLPLQTRTYADSTGKEHGLTVH